MYLNKPGCTPHKIQNGLYTVYIPPRPPHNEIDGWELAKKDQKWRRRPLPQFYIDRRPEERKRQKEQEKFVKEGIMSKVEYCDPVLETYRREEWRRRIFGHWFMCNGKAMYITGDHYMYLQWSKLDVGYPTFYQPQIDRFYFRELCWQHPFCLGYLFVGPRGFGKTAEEVACTLSNMTRPPHSRHAAIQSKVETDAKEVVFQEKMVEIFNNYPDFFKPKYSHGTNPKEKMTFRKKSSLSADDMDDESFIGNDNELGSTIKCFASGDKAVDGKTLSNIISDEIGKTEDADVYKRHRVQLKAVYRNDIKRGIIRSTTTVEEMDKGGAECFAIWEESDPHILDPLGYTTSKIFRYLVSALDTQSSLVDEYGFIDPVLALERVMQSRDSVKSDPYKLAMEIRKTPLSAEEAFMTDQSNSMFNVMLMTAATTRLETYRATDPSKDYPGRNGRLEYMGDTKDKDVYWVDDPHGPFRSWYQPDEWLNPDRKLLNAIKSKWDPDGNKGEGRMIYLPVNNDLWRGGGDPIRNVKTDDPRASKFAAYGISKFLPHLDMGKDRSEWISANLMWRYHARSDDPEDDFENIIKAMRYWGSSLMVEGNIDEFNKYVYRRGYWKFLVKRKNFDPTILNSKGKGHNSLNADEPAQATSEVIDSYVTRIRTDLKKNSERYKDIDLLKQMAVFEPKTRTKSDLVVAYGHALLSLEADLSYIEDEYSEESEPEYFNKYDISGSKSVPVNNIATPRTRDDDDDSGEKSEFDDPYYLQQLLSGR